MTSARIRSLRGWEALDSRGNPTVACRVELESGVRGRAVVPSGASTGRHEAQELRDGGERYGGRGVRAAIRNINGPIAAAIRGHEVRETDSLDELLRELDGTPSLGRLGANAILAVSVAGARAAAAAEGIPLYRWLLADEPPLLPLPMINIVSGGAHARGGVDVQDILAVPVGARCFGQALEWCRRVRESTRALVSERGLVGDLVADEGGLGPALPTNREAVEIVERGFERAGLEPISEMAIAIDVAATQLLSAGGYSLRAEGRTLTADEFVEELNGWCGDLPIVSVEDGLGEDDWSGWEKLTDALGDSVQLVGDDLFATNPERLALGVRAGVANAVLVKPNQAGTLSTAREVIRAARSAGYATIVSARSGETEDDWLSDLAVGWRAGQIKVGSTTRSERTSKWNRLLEIEDELGDDAAFAGVAALAGRAAKESV